MSYAAQVDTDPLPRAPASVIDLRSDTVTKPSPAMRKAMAEAAVGDDVFEDDPTVIELEHASAAVLGYEAGLFVASGTMGNICAVTTHTQRSSEIILGDASHIFLNEVAGAATIASVQSRAVPNRGGELDPDEVRSAIRGANVHFPRTSLICLENTHNFGGGKALSAAWMQSIGAVAAEHGIPIHLDGARIFNAAVALGVDVKELTRGAASTNVCLSKGLGAPVGSVLCGSKQFIAEARRVRKMLGGGMRQAGVLAAPGLIALREGPKLLANDHQNAKRLAERIAQLPGATIDPWPDTNIVFFKLDVQEPGELAKRWLADGVYILHLGGGRFRAVTHLDILPLEIEKAADVVALSVR